MTMTTIKVPTRLRDRIKANAAAGESQAETIARALDRLERAQFHEAVARQVPDGDYLAEAEQWERASLVDLA